MKPLAARPCWRLLRDEFPLLHRCAGWSIVRHSLNWRILLQRLPFCVELLFAFLKHKELSGVEGLVRLREPVEDSLGRSSRKTAQDYQNYKAG